MPRLIGVQESGGAYLAEAWAAGEDVLTKEPIAASTVADSISADIPRDRLKAMRAVVDTGGAFVVVDDDAILAAIPAVATGWRRLRRAGGRSGVRWARDGGRGGARRTPTTGWSSSSTGSGLKDVAAAMRAVEQRGSRAVRIPPTIDGLDPVIEGVAARGGER